MKTSSGMHRRGGLEIEPATLIPDSESLLEMGLRKVVRSYEQRRSIETSGHLARDHGPFIYNHCIGMESKKRNLGAIGTPRTQ